ncbi:MAG TPA: bifunctional UDP-N-acetylglucosamine diphosphorylase/glucosamine-1-phosphate N-acetyltransferase GlmU [Candidatus Acidoferrales bacterium]|nr:bifunctional UDP-N-acetylglucosamine diphosphorylase/glucosamine-1-phosphate N-acetyltransferase GlmU [Candidatus Acidoferrales bacterium]
MAGSNFVVVILAAGKGTRLRSSLAKVLHRAGGRTLVEHVARACRPLGARAIFAIVGHQADEVAAAVTPLGVRTVLQQPQRGTGHAMLVARRAIGKLAKYALVVPGDAPLVRTETLRALVRTHLAGNAAATILTADLADPSGYGRILRKSDAANSPVKAIIEESALSDELRGLTEINSSIYCFTLEKLWPHLGHLRPDNVHHELYLTDAMALLAQQGETVLAEVARDPQEALGCNTRADLAEVDRILRQRKRAALMDAGVTIQLPETVLIDPEVEIGPDTVIEPGVHLLGKTRVGRLSTIRTGSVISDCTLGDNVVVEPHCVAVQSRLASGTTIGPFARLRPGAELRAGARVGNFVEVKKAVLEEGVKAMHLSYLGDARVGRDSNIGAGTITCNFDGFRKNLTSIGKRVFVGSDSALVAPIRIGDGAYIGAGSTVTENVPPGALAIARGRQANKPGWVAKHRREMAAGEAAHSRPKRAAKKRPRPNRTRPKPRRKAAAHKPTRRR